MEFLLLSSKPIGKVNTTMRSLRSMLGVACSLGLLAAAVPTATAQLTPQEMDNALLDGFSVRGYQLVDLDLPQTAGDDFMTTVDISGNTYTLDLQHYSMRADNFRVTDGNGTEFEVGPAVTYRGSVIEAPGSSARVSLYKGQLTGMLYVSEDWVYGIQPVNEILPDAPSTLHIIYMGDDVIKPDNNCGLEDLVDGGVVPDSGRRPVDSDAGGVHTQGTVACEIAFDADGEFYNRNGSSVDNTIADIETVMNGVENIYEGDIGVVYAITEVIVRTNPNTDPYTSTDAGTRLDQFRSHWNSQQRSVHRDVAHLMTGANLNGGTIGVAWLGVICSSTTSGFGYGLSESRFTSNMTTRICLTAHELGHNWNAGHCCGGCSGCSSCRIMCPCINGCSGICTSFGSSSISQMNAHKNSRNCLGPPIPDLEIIGGPFDRGTVGTITVNGEPNTNTRVYYSLVGEANDACNDPVNGIFLNLIGCRFGDSGTTNGSGTIVFNPFIPNIGGGARLLWLQASQPGAESNVVLTQIN